MEKEIKDFSDILDIVKEKFKDYPYIIKTFENCYMDTLNKTIKIIDDEAYVITGDISAMWLRDSSAQIRPFLFLGKNNKKVQKIITGLIKRQIRYINIDPYANAFNETDNGNAWAKDKTDYISKWVWERKFEIDSLCYPIQLAYLYWKNTGQREHFTEEFFEAVRKIIEVFCIERDHENKSSYFFIRENSFFQDTLSRNGKGALVNSNIGLIWSGFRPSDDACVYGYLIPSNMFASVILNYIYEICNNYPKYTELGLKAKQISEEIKKAIEKYATTEVEGIGKIYAYEVDGYGQYNLMDDANIPSLLSMNYLGYEGNKDIENNTMKFILSEGNPYYYSGAISKGIGSPHTPIKYVWHLSKAVEGLVKTTNEEKLNIINEMVSTDGGTNFMHEGYNVDNPNEYTRSWFSWANSMFCELVLQYCGLYVRIN